MTTRSNAAKVLVLLLGTTILLGVSTIGMTQEARSNVVLEMTPANEIAGALEKATMREGPPPETPDGIPHQQQNQNAPVAMQEALRNAVSSLPGLRFEPTPFSLSGSVGWRLEQSLAQGPADAFIRDSLEFGHQHVPEDGSMHLLLPVELAQMVLEKGWGVLHPLTDAISGELSEYLMVFGPRDEHELRTVWIIAQISYYQARGLSLERGN